MFSSKTILILSVLIVLLLPTVLFADERPYIQPDKAAHEAVESPEVAADAGPEYALDEDAPSAFIHSFDTTILPAGGEDSGSKPYLEVPASALDRNILHITSAGSADVKAPVEKNIRMFTSGLKGRFTKWLERSGKYVGLMKNIFRENYLPEELVFLALIESGFNPKAYSWANASGPWQFIKGTGKRYGLRIDGWVDERRDPIKSTRAAAAYLKDLYDMFGTWSLAMASYNAGEGNVARAVNRGGTLDFWELRKTRLPQETKEYVPKFLAAKMIAQNPDLFGFGGLEYDQPFEFDEVVVSKSISLKTVARCCGVPVDDIKDLNPELIRSCTPPTKHGYTLRVPKGARELFLANYDGTPEPVTNRYVVKRGDTLKKLAKKFGTTVAELCETNGIRKLRTGQRLEIPVSDPSPAPVPEVTVAENTVVVGDSPEAPETAVQEAKSDKHIVHRGDTLYSIALKYGMAPSELAGLNGISRVTKVKIGQVLLVSADALPKADAPAPAKHRDVKTYRVKRGDTLWNIAQRFGVTVENLLRTNSMSKRSKIRVGQRLVIPSEKAA